MLKYVRNNNDKHHNNQTNKLNNNPNKSIKDILREVKDNNNWL